MRVAILKSSSFVNYDVDPSGQILRVTGYLKEFLERTQELLKTKFIYKEPPDSNWGKQLLNGSFSGMIGMVHRNESDLAVGPFGMTEDRFLAVQFSSSLVSGHLGILTWVTDEYKTTQWWEFTFLQTFDDWVWICAFCLLIICPVVEGVQYALFSPCSKFQYFLQELLHFWGIFLGQGQSMDSDILKKFVLKHSVKALWLLTSTFLMHWCFGGEILSRLVVSKPPQLINSLEDFLKLPQIYPMFCKDTIIDIYLKESESETAKYVWKKAKSDRSTYMEKDCYLFASILNALKPGKRAYISNWSLLTSFLAKLSRNPTCYGLHLSKTSISHHMALAIGRHLPAEIIKMININVDRVVSAGIIQKFLENIHARGLPCLVNDHTLRDESTKVALRFKHLYSVFLVHLIGISSSVLVFIFEVLSRLRRSLVSSEE